MINTCECPPVHFRHIERWKVTSGASCRIFPRLLHHTEMKNQFTVRWPICLQAAHTVFSRDLCISGWNGEELGLKKIKNYLIFTQRGEIKWVIWPQMQQKTAFELKMGHGKLWLIWINKFIGCWREKFHEEGGGIDKERWQCPSYTRNSGHKGLGQSSAVSLSHARGGY